MNETLSPRFAGSRMHVLDWLDGGDFETSMNEMLRGTGFLVPRSGRRIPSGWNDPAEAQIGRECGGLVSDPINVRLLNWWLAKTRGAKLPNWDLAAAAIYAGGRPGLVLAEAKAHVEEFTNEAAGQRTGAHPENVATINAAIGEARDALAKLAPKVAISREHWYQLSNRIAFAWKLASEGIATALIYVGFTGDEGMARVGEPLRSSRHWRETIALTEEVLPADIWEREIDCGAAPLWLLIRSRPCLRQSVLKNSFEGFSGFDDHGMPSDREFWSELLPDEKF